MSTDDSDITLVLAARGGDKAAFAAVLGRHWPMLLALCRRSLGDPLLAEDAAQEAAVQALLSLDGLRRAERFDAWLGGIGLNICRRWRRYQAREVWSWEALQGGWRAPEPRDWRPEPAELVEEADLAARVRRAVAALPPGQRAAVLLFYLSGLTHAETAAHLGIEVGAVKTRLHKARRALRRQLWTVWMEETMTADVTSQPIAVRVTDVRRTPARDDGPRHHVVLLEEIDGARRLPIWVGAAEGEPLALSLEKIQTPRPMAYAFAAALLDAAGGRLREVRISRLVHDVFYAVAVVDGPAGPREIDARPSDALNLALVTGAPITVEAAVFEAERATKQVDVPDEAKEMARSIQGEGSEGAAEIVAGVMARWHRPAPSAAPTEPAEEG
jgi:RNA polymerase sigma factor (sigma-70 family)